MVYTKMAKHLTIWQRYLLLAQAILLCILTLKVSLTPSMPNPILFSKDYDKTQIENWQNIDRKSLNPDEIGEVSVGNFQGGSEQVFTQQNQVLTLKSLTFSQSNGDLKKYLKNYSDNLIAITQYDAAIGYYALFPEKHHLTMTACLTASGKATVTADQFKVTQIRAAFQMGQLWRWLTNQDQLVPHTCYWRSLSISPITADSPQILPSIWQGLSQ